MTKAMGRLLCLLGLHAYDVVDVTMGFGPGGSVAKLQCRRCGSMTTRRT